MTLHLGGTTDDIEGLINQLLEKTPERMSQLLVKITANGRALTEETCKSIYRLYIKLGQIRPDVDLRVNVESLKGRDSHLPNSDYNLVLGKDIDCKDSKKVASSPINLKDNVVLGGTFDRLHIGHKILLTEAVVRCNKKLTVGVTDESMITSKKLWELIEPVDRRIEQVQDFLQHIDGGLTYEVVPISDMFGPTQTDPDLDLIVVSAETEKGGHKVNSVRKEKSMNELEMHVVELVQAENTDEADEQKISSSNGRLRLLGNVLQAPKPKQHLPDRPYLIGLTGGIASGKSNVGRVLASKGAGLIDCDKVAHTLYKKDTPTYLAVVEMFGPGVVSSDGEINRRALGDIVFNSKEALERLNNLLWPAILDAAVSEASKMYKEEQKEVVVLEAAVLLQAGWEKAVHQVWTCIIPPNEAVQRVMKRNNISEAAAQARLAAQPSNKAQVAIANIVFCSLYSYEYTHSQVSKAWTALLSLLASQAKL